MIFKSGKYIGKTHDYAADHDPAWVCVSYEHSNPHGIDKATYLACVDECEERKQRNELEFE